MKVYSYHPTTGAFIGTDTASESPLEPGVFLIPAHATKIEPPKPRSGHTPHFDTKSDKWVNKKNPEVIRQKSEPIDHAQAARNRRNQLLNESDWVGLRAADLNEAVPMNWFEYRQALRDVPDQKGFPENINWPQKP